MRMKHWFFLPSPFLAPYVDYYFAIENGKPDADNREQDSLTVFPTPQGQMVFSYGESPTFEKWLGEKTTHSPDFAIGGYMTKSVEYTNTGDLGAIMVGFKPWGVQAFLDFELKSVTNANSDMHLHFGSAISFVEEMLCEAEGIQERIRIIETFLAGRMRRPCLDEAMINAVGLIAQSKGTLTVEQLAKECYMSRRTLLRRFEAAIGISPKPFARIVRFQNLFKSIENQAAELEWSQVAFEAGFSDQAHFINDFRAFSGMSPARFLEDAQRTKLGLGFDEQIKEDALYGKIYL